MTVTLSASLAVMGFAALASLGTEWAPMDRRLVLLVLGSSVFVFAGYLFSVMAMRVGEVAFVSPFRYTGLIWALLLGWLAFGHWPEPLTLIGASIVVATGLFTLFRERAIRA